MFYRHFVVILAGGLILCVILLKVQKCILMILGALSDYFGMDTYLWSELKGNE